MWHLWAAYLCIVQNRWTIRFFHNEVFFVIVANADSQSANSHNEAVFHSQWKAAVFLQNNGTYGSAFKYAVISFLFFVSDNHIVLYGDVSVVGEQLVCQCDDRFCVFLAVFTNKNLRVF